jgi:hypothetical protein
MSGRPIKHTRGGAHCTWYFKKSFTTLKAYTVDSRLSARGLTALRLNRGNVFLKKKFYFP